MEQKINCHYPVVTILLIPFYNRKRKNHNKGKTLITIEYKRFLQKKEKNRFGGKNSKMV